LFSINRLNSLICIRACKCAQNFELSTKIFELNKIVLHCLNRKF
jgi:hypothetical protein